MLADEWRRFVGRRGVNRPGVLYITYGFPYPPTSGMRLRDYHLIKAVSRRYDVSLLSLLERPEERADLDALRPYCASIDTVPATRRSRAEKAVGLARCVLGGRPLHSFVLGYPEMHARIRDIASRHDIRLVQIEHSYMAHYLDALPEGRAYRTILEFHNIGSVQYGRMLRLRSSLSRKARHLLEWQVAKRWEPRYARRFDRCVVVSPSDAQALGQVDGAIATRVVDNGVDTEQLRLLPDVDTSLDLLFVGTMSYAPNVDAVLYFCRHILPEVQRRAPGARLIVVGNAPAPSIRRLTDRPDVLVTGGVPAVEPYYARSAVSVVPLRAGGGTRLKILESMALGRPVVSTRVGCEGLEVEDGQHLLVADEPTAFADHVVTLLQDHALRRALTSRARALVEGRYAWSILGERLMETYAELLG